MGRIDLLIEAEKKEPERSHIDEDDDSKTSYNEHAASIYKDSDLFLSAKYGRLDEFSRVLDRIASLENSSPEDILSRVSPAGNTFVHVAAKHGKVDVLIFIAAKSPQLMLAKNLNGDTALHLAVKAEDMSTVNALEIIHLDLMMSSSEDNNLFRAKNEKGNTALHEAFKNGHEWLAQHLIRQDPEVSYYQNKDGESALYLAAAAGFVACVSDILDFSTDQERMNELFSTKSPINAAIKRKNLDVLEAMLNRNPTLIQIRDGKGRNPLHHAASWGYLKEIEYLLQKYPPSATQSDRSGECPIHLASRGGHVDAISLLLRYCPEPEELLNKFGHNILHVAAKSGKCNVVNYILKNDVLEGLINMKDKRGNAPLHLATVFWHPEIVNVLTWDKRVDIKVVNDKKMTALDAAVDHMRQNPPFRQRLTWAALKAAGTPQSPQSKFWKASPNKSHNMNFFKERVNTLLVVSTLVATITFAAGFTMPGGYNSSDTDLGMATMLRHKGFQVFVLCDTIAMYCSTIVAVVLIWAQLGDIDLLLTVLSLTLPLLGIALSMMSMAFTAGVFLVVNKLHWLSTVVLVMGFTFLAIFWVLFIPFCLPYTSNNLVLRYLYYYPFCLLIYVTRGSLPEYY